MNKMDRSDLARLPEMQQPTIKERHLEAKAGQFLNEQQKSSSVWAKRATEPYTLELANKPLDLENKHLEDPPWLTEPAQILIQGVAATQPIRRGVHASLTARPANNWVAIDKTSNIDLVPTQQAAKRASDSGAGPEFLMPKRQRLVRRENNNSPKQYPTPGSCVPVLPLSRSVGTMSRADCALPATLASLIITADPDWVQLCKL